MLDDKPNLLIATVAYGSIFLKNEDYNLWEKR